ncbi:MAG TPA: hydrophobe/amphiphile efflux-1 family RND transporter, partial [Cytophagales bacterium]|nr:hydrophobe/amphiphile efflux-1 family RND transporter [Cytophagales bacterium]
IGIVVDDAIVVVEAVHAKMAEEHLSPYRAVQKVLGEISGAVIAITLLMTAVFVPIAFMSGPVGVFYRQFSITMASSIILSGLVALTLTPVLCAMILKNTHGRPRKRNLLNRFLDSFNAGFEKLTGRYVWLLQRIAKRRAVTVGLWILFTIGIYFIAEHLPAGFIPPEDQGMIYAIVQTPPGSTLERTNDISRQLQEIIQKVEGVQSVSSIAGYEVLTEGRGSNAATCLINLKPWSERKHNVQDITIELEEKAKELPGATIEFFDPPAVPGFGAAGGFALQLLDKNPDGTYEDLERVKNEFMDALSKRKELTGLFTFFSSNYPQYEIEIDNQLAMQKGVSIGNAMNTLSIFVGSTYELGFIKYQRFFKVFVQAAPEFRQLPQDVLNLWVKNDRDEMVPFSSFMKIKKKQGANEINRYNMYNTAAIRGGPAKGYSSGEAIAAVKEVAAKILPRGFDIDWAALSYDEVRRGNEAIYIFLIVLGFVYLVLAAQYESFIIPLAVVLSLPAGVFGSFMLIKSMGLANDIYAQVGLIMLVGLLGKNAVLIVEFAVQKNRQGASILEAAIEGAKVRFRPILMTSFAFIAGLIPLVIAHGAGAIGNRTIGSSALGGMLFGTVFGVIIVPGLYYIFGKLAEGRSLIRDEEKDSLSEGIVHKVDHFPTTSESDDHAH